MPEPSTTGGCLCGGVRFELTRPAEAAGYCHCTRCQKRTGSGSSAQARIDGTTFRLLRGEELVQAWRHPEGGFEKCFCRVCGSHLFSRNPEAASQMSIRMAAFDGDPGVRVSAGPLGEVLEGASRPGHFDGVLTVVGKLLHLTAARSAYFGQKDAQQLLLIRRMVRDIDFPVDVVSVPTVREADGLAMSSRNMYLTESDRETALCLSRALQAGGEAASFGPSAIRRAAREVLVEEPLALVDYLVLVHPHTLADVPEWYRGEALLAVAARVGTTRLIDNTPLLVGPGGGPLDVFSDVSHARAEV